MTHSLQPIGSLDLHPIEALLIAQAQLAGLTSLDQLRLAVRPR